MFKLVAILEPRIMEFQASVAMSALTLFPRCFRIFMQPTSPLFLIVNLTTKKGCVWQPGYFMPHQIYPFVPAL